MVYYITDQIRTTLNNTEGQAAPSKTEQQQKTPVITESKRDQHGVAIPSNDS